MRGTSAVLKVDDSLNPLLTRELLNGLVHIMHPHGKGDSQRTAEKHKATIEWFVAALSERGHTGGVGELTRAGLAELWWQAGNRRESESRRVLSALDAETSVLSPEVRALVGGRHYNRHAKGDPLQPYDETAWENLAQACRAVIRKSWSAHQQALAAAAAGRDPYTHGWSEENICWQLAEHGPRTRAALGEAIGLTVNQSAYQLPQVIGPREALFPTTTVMLAYQLLFGVYTGIVPDGIDDLGLEGIEWAGEATVLVRYLKGRTSHESLTLSRQAVRLLERWLEHSALARRHCPPQSRSGLWLRFEYAGQGPHKASPWRTTRAYRSTITKWVHDHGVVDETGVPIAMHRHRIRTTFESHRDRKTWFGSGRATIDPNHTPGVEGDRYLSAATAAQKGALESIVEQAQGDLLRQGRPPMVLSEQEIADLAQQFPQLVSELELDETAIAELVGGERDVFVASCLDPLAGLHGPKGKACPARPWVCLLCPLSVFAPGHAANLLRMKAFFARQWQQMPAAQFMAVFGHYAQRIEEVLAKYDPAQLARAAAEVHDTDDEIPLFPEEGTQ
jgi:hypothetical protein